MSSAIQFFSEDVDFQLENEDLVAEWIEQIVKKHKHSVEQLDYIFCSDEYLLKINQEHLQHDYYTDIITFPYHEEGAKNIYGDLYISVDRVRENAGDAGISFIDEMHRVAIHGVLHLVGLSDKNAAAEIEMRKAENVALSLRMF
jgi:probable rRNA maturation factor